MKINILTYKIIKMKLTNLQRFILSARNINPSIINYRATNMSNLSFKKTYNYKLLKNNDDNYYLNKCILSSVTERTCM